MFKQRIDFSVLSDISWWHWAATVPLLAAHLAGYPHALGMAMGLCAVVGVYFFAQLKQLQPIPVQIRIVYLAMLAIGMLPGMAWVHWMQLIGTTVMVTAGYCLLQRLLTLLPFNRQRALSAAGVWRIFFRDPRMGGLVRGGMATESGALEAPMAMSCSIKQHRQSRA